MIPKFRAWHKDSKLMLDVLAIYFKHKHILADIETRKIYPDLDYWWKETDIPFSEIILMQSTGLFDKNGKEIFEGDVVRYTWDMPSDVNATEKGKKVRISKVFWSDWRASWAIGKMCCNNDLFRYARNGNTVEIIGNIYQNQELLGDTDA